MITLYDKFIIAIYFIFILAIGLIFRRLNKSTSDYFRCGGAMPWWITGTSAWLATFSAWTFTGRLAPFTNPAPSSCACITAMSIGAIFLLAYTGVRFRRMRSITWMEAVRARYGPGTEQFYTWLKIPILLFTAGVGLNAIGVFMAAVFQVDVRGTLIILGSLVTIVAFMGGAWAVLASDFVQMCLIVTISLVVAFLAVRQPHIGGISGLLHQLPATHFHWLSMVRRRGNDPVDHRHALVRVFLCQQPGKLDDVPDGQERSGRAGHGGHSAAGIADWPADIFYPPARGGRDASGPGRGSFPP